MARFMYVDKFMYVDTFFYSVVYFRSCDFCRFQWTLYLSFYCACFKNILPQTVVVIIYWCGGSGLETDSRLTTTGKYKAASTEPSPVLTV